MSRTMAGEDPLRDLDRLVSEVGEAFLEIYRERPIAPALPEDLDPQTVARLFDEPLPETGRLALDVVREIRQQIVPNSLNLANPMTFGLMVPHPLPLPAMLDALISALNQNLGCAWRTAPAAIHVERQIIRWLLGLVGWLAEGSGHLTSGGASSNLTALRVAMQHRFPASKRDGLRSLPAQPVVYVSDQGHFSIDRAAQVLGLGGHAVHKIPSGPDGAMRTSELEKSIESDRVEGRAPLVVVATAGTTASGAIDPLPEVGEICRRHALWLHVDAAYGGALLFSERFGSLLSGIERADSVTLDPHKWLFMPLATGLFLTRHGGLLEETFGEETAYLGARHVDAALSAPPGYFEVSLDSSRRFNGLKLWAALRHLGRRGISNLVERQVELGRWLGERLAAVPGIELAHAPRLNIVCLRRTGRPAAEADGDTESLRRELEREAGCWLTTTTLRGGSYVRINLLNWAVRRTHVERLAGAVAAIMQRESRPS